MASVPAPLSDDEFEFDRGEAGGSIELEYRRRKGNRERRARERHPRVGRLLLALNDEPQDQRAFQIGARGERTVAESLERATASGPAVTLNNRRMPRGRGDIDHIVIAPSGVYVIDTKAVRGKVTIDQPWFGETKLRINGSDCTKYITGLDRQVGAVRDALGGFPAERPPIQGVLCFTKADLPLLRTQTVGGHLLMYRRPLRKRLSADGPLSPAVINELAGMLAATLPAA